MAVIAVSSASGSPGVSTLAMALAMTSAQKTLLVEADTSTTSRLIPGALSGQIRHDHGLTNLAIADYRGELTEQALWAESVELTDTLTFLPGFRTLISADHADDRFWGALIPVLRAVAARGIDIVIDLGQIRHADQRLPLLRFAESVVVVVRNTLPDVASLHALVHPSTPGSEAGWLRRELENIGHESWIDLVTIDHPTTAALADWSAYTVPGKDVQQLVDATVLAGLPWDRKGSAPFTFAMTQQPPRRAAYPKAVAALATRLHEALQERTAVTLTPTEGLS